MDCNKGSMKAYLSSRSSSTEVIAPSAPRTFHLSQWVYSLLQPPHHLPLQHGCSLHAVFVPPFRNCPPYKEHRVVFIIEDAGAGCHLCVAFALVFSVGHKTACYSWNRPRVGGRDSLSVLEETGFSPAEVSLWVLSFTLRLKCHHH